MTHTILNTEYTLHSPECGVFLRPGLVSRILHPVYLSLSLYALQTSICILSSHCIQCILRTMCCVTFWPKMRSTLCVCTVQKQHAPPSLNSTTIYAFQLTLHICFHSSHMIEKQEYRDTCVWKVCRGHTAAEHSFLPAKEIFGKTLSFIKVSVLTIF